MSIVARHYPKIPRFVRRNKGDMSREALDAQILGRSVLAEALLPKPVHPQLVSTAHGTIDQLLLTIPAYAVDDVEGGGDNPLGLVYQDLLTKLPSATSLVILTHESTAAAVEAWLSAAGRSPSTVIAVANHLHFSVWAEDGYVVVRDGPDGATFFVEPYEFPRFADGLIADFVTHQTDLEDTQAPLYFQGGNVLIGDDFFFIGADYPANSLRYINRVIISDPGEQPAATVRRLYREYLDTTRTLHYIGSTIPVPAETTRSIQIDGEPWSEVIYMGNRPGTVQPLFHIDMFITLAGRTAAGAYQVLVGDPRMAAGTLGVPVWPHAMQEVFDNIASSLTRLGFAVVRNPLPLVYVDDPPRRERLWYFATANNALVEITGTTKSVWLPSYGFGEWTTLTRTDDENKRIWQQLGFTVQMLGDFHPFAENLGAVHCIKKYLARA